MSDQSGTVTATPEIGHPTVVVSHVSITYRVLGGERRSTVEDTEDEISLIRRVLRPSRGERVREVEAVTDVSFVAHHGESIGVIGHNGSGKSTLLRAVAGLIPPSAGRLWVAGQPSLLGVNAVLINKLSGQRNIYVGGQALGLSKAEIDEKFDDIVDFSGIGDAVYLPMSTYSSGMGARLRFAISTAASPEVLMIDEALATGDAAFRQKSSERIAAIREKAGTVFLVSHSSSNIRRICDRVLWMDRGRLIADGPTEEVMKAYEATLPKKPAPAKKSTPADPDVPGTRRWTGETRFQIARAASRDTWEPGVEGCLIVSVDSVATARMVAPIAARLGWPIVWMNSSGLPPSARGELGRLDPRRVVVVGHDGDISDDLQDQIEQQTSAPVERLGDRSPSTTAALLLEAFPPGDPSTVYVTRPVNAARESVVSLVAARTGRAVVACGGSSAGDELLSALAKLRPRRLVMVGHEEEWPTVVVDQLREATEGEIRYSTHGPMALAAAQWDDVEPGGRVLVSGATVVEFLTATSVAVATASPLLLVGSTPLPGVVRKTLERLAPSEIVLCGMLPTLPPAMRAALGELVTPQRP